MTTRGDQESKHGSGSSPRLRVAASDPSLPRDTTAPPPLPPILHQPIVAVSLILICATAAQITVWLVNARLLASTSENLAVDAAAPLIANPVPYTALSNAIERFNRSQVPSPRILFSMCLVLAMIAPVAWYAAARVLIGPVWGLWTGVLWGLYPPFAFVAQRPGPLALALATVPAAWALLLFWSRSRHRRAGFLGGLTAGAAAVISFPMLPAFTLASPLLLLATRFRRKALQGFLLAWLGFCLPLAGLVGLVRAERMANPLTAFGDNLVGSLDSNDGSIMSRAMRAPMPEGSTTSSRLLAIAREVRRSPIELPSWLIRRCWKTLYSTPKGYFQRPLFVVQMILLVPAAWGMIVCLRQRLWRWPASAGLVLIACFWITAAFADPLAQSLAPAGGMAMILALVAVADVYHRFDH